MGDEEILVVVVVDVFGEYVYVCFWVVFLVEGDILFEIFVDEVIIVDVDEEVVCYLVVGGVEVEVVVVVEIGDGEIECCVVYCVEFGVFGDVGEVIIVVVIECVFC